MVRVFIRRRFHKAAQVWIAFAVGLLLFPFVLDEPTGDEPAIGRFNLSGTLRLA